MNATILTSVGVLVSLALFVTATIFYPGGYDWSRDFICTLFVPVTPDGVVNRALYLAVAAMFVLCTSVAIVFNRISHRAGDRRLGKTLEIGGIGSMVYAFFVVTPMHDLVLAISLAFFIPAMLAALRLVALEERRSLLWTGWGCFGLLLAGVVMYYGRWLSPLLPLTQKAIFATSAVWLLVLQAGRTPATNQPRDNVPGLGTARCS
jgi:hypothetical protein